MNFQPIKGGHPARDQHLASATQPGDSCLNTPEVGGRMLAIVKVGGYTSYELYQPDATPVMETKIAQIKLPIHPKVCVRASSVGRW